MTDPHDQQPMNRHTFVPYSPMPAPPARGPRSRAAQIALVAGATAVVVLVVLGIIGLGIFVAGSAATTKDARASSSGTATPALTAPVRVPVVPSITQVHRNRILTTTLTAPATCDLPAWSTELTAMTAFTNAATGCFGQVWGTRLAQVTLFDSPDGIAPASTGCPTTRPTFGFWTCARGSASNYRSMVSILGTQSGAGLEWLARIAAERIAFESGQNADVTALVTSVGGPTSPSGIEYLRRQEAQRACLTGATVGMLIDRGVTRAEIDVAAAAAGLWTEVADNKAIQLNGTALTTWFTRGTSVRRTAPCGDAWMVPVGDLP